MKLEDVVAMLRGSKGDEGAAESTSDGENTTASEDRR